LEESVSATPQIASSSFALAITHEITDDLDGRPVPPIDNDLDWLCGIDNPVEPTVEPIDGLDWLCPEPIADPLWVLVRRLPDQRSLWRRSRSRKTKTRAADHRRRPREQFTRRAIRRKIMAFGKRKTGGDLKPLLKWDGRVGRFYTQDQVDGQPEQKDVTDSFCAVIDLESAEKGWLRFPKGAAPEMDLFPLDVDDIGDPPEGDGWKEGLRFQSRLEGQDVWRETLTAAVGLWRGLDELHTQYVEQSKDHPGMLPMVEIADVHTVSVKTGAIHTPTFTITGWVNKNGGTEADREASDMLAKDDADMDDKIPF
jgi:hypothetical protein